MYFDSFIEKTVLFLFFIHVDIVFLGIPNFSDVALFAVPFSVSRMIFTFALLRFCLTANILRLNQILFHDPIILFSFIFTLNVTFEFQKSSVLVVFCAVEEP